MAEQTEFDAYHKWLGIPPGEQPPNFYRLLGAAVYESDPDVIEAAADQRMAHVRTYQTGKHGAISQKLLNELAEARLTLLNPAKKAEYDARLGSQTASDAAPDLAEEMLAAAPLLVSPPISRSVPRRKRPKHAAISALAGAACVFVLAAAYVMFGRRRAADDAPAAAQESRNPRQTVSKQKDDGRSSRRPLGVTADAAASKPSHTPSPVRVLQTKTEKYPSDGSDIASNDGGSFVVSTSGEVGEAAVGYELDGARHLVLEAKVAGELRPYDENSFAGLMVDYHTQFGYVSRVALSLGLSHEGRESPGPLWGRQAPADRLVALAEAELDTLDLEQWAPATWDGRVWLSALLQNSGPGASITGRLVLPGAKNHEGEKPAGQAQRSR
ncbi:MAG TPA: hypothetical protein VNH11_03695 [Pirellulales bacterium]|nr:hypothetical protein [Pirellulales bacterium]